MTICEQNLYERMENMVGQTIPPTVCPCDCTPIHEDGTRTVFINERYIVIANPSSGYNSGNVKIYNAHNRKLISELEQPEQYIMSFGQAIWINESGIDDVIGVSAYYDTTGKMFIFDVKTGALLHTVAQPYIGYSLWFGISGIIGVNNESFLLVDTDANNSPLYRATNGGELAVRTASHHQFDSCIPGEHCLDYFGMTTSVSYSQEQGLMFVYGQELSKGSWNDVQNWIVGINSNLEMGYEFRVQSYMGPRPGQHFFSVNSTHMFFIKDNIITKTAIPVDNDTEPTILLQKNARTTLKFIVTNDKYVCVLYDEGNTYNNIGVYSAETLEPLGEIEAGHGFTSAWINCMFIQSHDGVKFIFGKSINGHIPIFDLDTEVDGNGFFKPDTEIADRCIGCNEPA